MDHDAIELRYLFATSTPTTTVNDFYNISVSTSLVAFSVCKNTIMEVVSDTGVSQPHTHIDNVNCSLNMTWVHGFIKA